MGMQLPQKGSGTTIIPPAASTTLPALPLPPPFPFISRKVDLPNVSKEGCPRSVKSTKTKSCCGGLPLTLLLLLSSSMSPPPLRKDP